MTTPTTEDLARLGRQLDRLENRINSLIERMDDPTGEQRASRRAAAEEAKAREYDRETTRLVELAEGRRK